MRPSHLRCLTRQCCAHRWCCCFGTEDVPCAADTAHMPLVIFGGHVARYPPAADSASVCARCRPRARTSRWRKRMVRQVCKGRVLRNVVLIVAAGGGAAERQMRALHDESGGRQDDITP
nr:hypothetical protein CFP56_30059 [Quercus suber]